jgi:hypothetical protein
MRKPAPSGAAALCTLQKKRPQRVPGPRGDLTTCISKLPPAVLRCNKELNDLDRTKREAARAFATAPLRGAFVGMNDAMGKEKKTAREIADLIEERIAKRSKIIVMRNHPMNGWHAQVVAPSHGTRLELQAAVDKISDTLRERYELE